MLNNKTVVIGITGGIAAYKSAELVRRLKKKGAEVFCVMTESAQQFITPLTMQTLSQNPVFTEMFGKVHHWNVEHISLADRADLLLVAPASANIIGKVSSGIADDLLTTTIMATKAPILMAPAMNVNMYQNPVTQRNIKNLKELGYHFVAPGYGDLACGYQGQGRLADLDVIMDTVEGLVEDNKPLDRKKVLVTAGPTCESIDPVRYLTNRSSGKMGYAIAREAHLMGAEVTLVSGPTALKPFSGVKLISVRSAQQMYEAVLKNFEDSDIVIKAAAVADYKPSEEANDKLKKQGGDLVLKLTRNPDILAELGQQKKSQILVGFAAETKDVINYATEKVKKKKLDFIVANDLTKEGAGFASESNIVTLIFSSGEVEKWPQMSKNEVARKILSKAANLSKEKECEGIG